MLKRMTALLLAVILVFAFAACGTSETTQSSEDAEPSNPIGTVANTLQAMGKAVESTLLSILEASYIVHFLEPDSNNLGKSIVKTPQQKQSQLTVFLCRDKVMSLTY